MLCQISKLGIYVEFGLIGLRLNYFFRPDILFCL